MSADIPKQEPRNGASGGVVFTSPLIRPAPRSLQEVEYRKKLLLVAALAVTLIVSAMSQTVVSTAAQNIVADIGGFSLFTWMFAGFSLASAVAVPIIGKLADMYGTRIIIATSFALFLVASAFAGLVPNMPMMIVARSIQGLGFAGVMGSVWVTTASMWAPQDRGKWLGALSASFTLAGVSGPVLGGWVSDEIGWRWVFWLNLPVGGLALWLLVRWFPKLPMEKRERHFDVAGAAAFTIFATAGLFAVSVGGDAIAWTSPVIIGLFAVSAASLAWFIRAELRAQDPVIPPSLFRHRVFSGSMAASLTVTISFVVATVFLPFLVIGAMGESATVAAFPLMTQAVGVALGSNFSGQVMSRWGYARELSAVGLAVTAVVLWVLGEMAGDVSIGMLSLLTLVMGTGISLSFTSFTVPVQNAMPEKVLGVVTTSLQFARVFGMAVGSAVLGAVMLAQLAVPHVNDPGPTVLIQDPEIVVSEERLGEVREGYLGDPALGQAAFEADLAASRANISDALSVVFRVASVVSVVGVALAVFTFTGAKREEP